ncbi:MAG: hypothetical protein P8X70_00950 [Nanoarchaeota archaeon]
MRKEMGKKGQEGAPLPVIITFLILGATAIVLFLFVTGFFGKGTNILEKASSLEISAQACGGYASSGLKTSYCNLLQNVEISGTKQHVNCEYLENYAEFEKLDEDCDEEKVADLARKQCQNLKDERLVNGIPCYIDGEGEDEWGLSKEHPLLIEG